MKNYISYHLTKTIPGPKVKINDPKEGFEIIREWTNKYTVGTYSEFSLRLTIPSKKYPSVDFLDNAFIREPLRATFDDMDLCEWRFVQAALPKLFEFIKTANDFFSRYDYCIIVSTEFIFLDKNNNLLKGQNLYNYNEHSHFLSFISKGELRIEPSFIFPFDSDNDSFNDFYKYFESNFPFKLNDKNLYLTIVNAKTKWGSTTSKLRK